MQKHNLDKLETLINESMAALLQLKSQPTDAMMIIAAARSMSDAQDLISKYREQRAIHAKQY